MKRWIENWDVVVPIFKFSKDVRKIIYTTNAIGSLNSSYLKLNRQRSVFPSDQALLKALYLPTFEATKKMDSADSQLGPGLRRNVHNVRRPPAGLIKKKDNFPPGKLSLVFDS